MLKMPSWLRSYGCSGSGLGSGTPQSGTGSSPLFNQTLLLRSFMTPRSFHLIPESWTARTTSGRPVVVSHALSMEAPVTPNNSCGFAFTTGSQLASCGCGKVYRSQAVLELYFQISPPRSLGGNWAGVIFM